MLWQYRVNINNWYVLILCPCHTGLTRKKLIIKGRITSCQPTSEFVSKFQILTDKNLQLMKLLSEKYVFGTVMLRLVKNFADEGTAKHKLDNNQGEKCFTPALQD